MDVEDCSGQETHGLPETTETVEKFDILKYLKATVKMLFGPVGNPEGHQDRRDFLRETLEFLESQASKDIVDVIRRDEAMEECGNLDDYSRFRWACDSCLEEHIFPLFDNLDKSVITELGCPPIHSDKTPRSMMVDFWFCVCRSSGGQPMTGRALFPEVCSKGFRAAITDGNRFAVKYFIDRTPSEEVNLILREKIRTSGANDFPLGLPFEEYCLLFTRMTEDQQRHEFGTFSFEVLGCLLQSRHEHFLEAARLLIDHLSDSCYWGIVWNIAHKAKSDGEDWRSQALSCKPEGTAEICVYQRLFTEFWDVGASHERNSSINLQGRHVLAYTVAMIDDDRIRDMVFGEISVELKEDLLMGSLGWRKHSFFLKWLRNRANVLLERFIGGCGKDNKGLLVKYRVAVVATSSQDVGRLWAEKFGEDVKGCQWRILLSALLEIVDNIMSEQ